MARQCAKTLITTMRALGATILTSCMQFGTHSKNDNHKQACRQSWPHTQLEQSSVKHSNTYTRVSECASTRAFVYCDQLTLGCSS